MFLKEVHRLRAIAIFIVVSTHCLPLFKMQGDGWAMALFHSLITNGTVYFMFIAGLLFEHQSVKFRFYPYLKKKLHYVIIPYVVVSMPVLLIDAIQGSGIFNPADAHHWPTLFQNVVAALLSGAIIEPPFWFIPMIAVFYLLAPALLWITRLRYFGILLPVTVILASFSHRPTALDHVWQSFPYFLPAYLYGMWFRTNYSRLIEWHTRWLPSLIVLAVGLRWFEIVILHQNGVVFSQTLFSQEHSVIDIDVYFKLLTSGIFLVGLRHAGSLIGRVLDYLAELSFGIFFLHIYVIVAFQHVLRGTIAVGFGAVFLLVTASLVTVLCIPILWSVRTGFGRNSRVLVGC